MELAVVGSGSRSRMVFGEWRSGRTFTQGNRRGGIGRTLTGESAHQVYWFSHTDTVEVWSDEWVVSPKAANN